MIMCPVKMTKFLVKEYLEFPAYFSHLLRSKYFPADFVLPKHFCSQIKRTSFTSIQHSFQNFYYVLLAFCKVDGI
jgi:hypothetical protein